MSESKEESERNRKLIKKSTKIILLGLIILTGLSLYVISLSPTMQEMVDAERPIERDVIVDLFVLKQSSARKFEPLYDSSSDESSGRLIIGDDETIGFNLSTNVPVHVALLSSMVQKEPKIVFLDAKIPPGEGLKLEKGGERFLFKTQLGQDVKFCLIHGKSTKELLSQLSKIRNVWMRAPDRQCAELKVLNE